MSMPTLHKPASPSGIELRNHCYPSSGETFGTLINLSGRRRVTSQRVILFAVLASLTHEGALAEAQNALGILSEAHYTLVEGNRSLPGVFSEQLHEAYYGHLQGHQKIGRFIALAQDTLAAIHTRASAASTLLQQLVDSANPMLALFNQITLVYEEELSRHTERTKRQTVELMHNIQSISKEASIVSINAQIIAAHAGGAGREFSVVARALSDITGRIDMLAFKALKTVNA
ncbi:hypothetical protein BH11PSE12_BH11PSE12_03620 [soil metagenome]